MDTGRFRRVLLKVPTVLVVSAVIAGWCLAAYEWGSTVTDLFVWSVEQSHAFLAPWIGNLPAAAVLMLLIFFLAAVIGAIVGTVAEFLDVDDYEGAPRVILRGLETALIGINVALYAIILVIPLYEALHRNAIFAAMMASLVAFGLLAFAARFLYLVVTIKGARVALSFTLASAITLFLIWEMFLTPHPMRLNGGEAVAFFGVSVGSWVWAYLDWNRRKRASSQPGTGFTFGLKQFDPPK